MLQHSHLAQSALQLSFGVQVEAEGDVATAFTLARILSNIPLSRGGPTSVVIFDIHALQVVPQPAALSIARGFTIVQYNKHSWHAPKAVRADWLSSSPCGGAALPQERFYFGDTVLPLFESGIPLLRERLRQLPDADNVTIAYPDEGAWKRFKYQFGDYPEVRREGCLRVP